MGWNKHGIKPVPSTRIWKRQSQPGSGAEHIQLPALCLLFNPYPQTHRSPSLPAVFLVFLHSLWESWEFCIPPTRPCMQHLSVSRCTNPAQTHSLCCHPAPKIPTGRCWEQRGGWKFPSVLPESDTSSGSEQVSNSASKLNRCARNPLALE